MCFVYQKQKESLLEKYRGATTQICTIKQRIEQKRKLRHENQNTSQMGNFASDMDLECKHWPLTINWTDKTTIELISKYKYGDHNSSNIEAITETTGKM